jgi:sulfite reductase alpha subunit
MAQLCWAAEKSPMAQDLLGILELSYEEKICHWKHGGIVGVKGYGGGVIGRYSDVPEKFPNVSHFHTFRVNHPAGWFYKTEALRRAHQPPRLHGGHHPPGHADRGAGAHIYGAHSGRV